MLYSTLQTVDLPILCLVLGIVSEQSNGWPKQTKGPSLLKRGQPSGPQNEHNKHAHAHLLPLEQIDTLLRAARLSVIKWTWHDQLFLCRLADKTVNKKHIRHYGETVYRRISLRPEAGLNTEFLDIGVVYWKFCEIHWVKTGIGWCSGHQENSRAKFPFVICCLGMRSIFIALN